MHLLDAFLVPLTSASMTRDLSLISSHLVVVVVTDVVPCTPKGYVREGVFGDYGNVGKPFVGCNGGRALST